MKVKAFSYHNLKDLEQDILKFITNNVTEVISCSHSMAVYPSASSVFTAILIYK